MVGKVSGLVHVTAPDNVVKAVMAAIGFTVLKQLQTEAMAMAMAMGDWLGEHLPGFFTQLLHRSK